MRETRIGFVGLGVMGRPMAGHLAAAGLPLAVHDLDPAAVDRFRADWPGTAAETPREMTKANIVVTMLPSGREVGAVAAELAEALAPGALLLDCSSADPAHTVATAALLAGCGVAMVDAPVSGAEAGAKAAELVFMVGGAEADVARAAPLLQVLGQSWFHLGPLGAGHAMKSINNLVTAITFMATAEGLILGKRYGLDPAAMTEVLNLSTGMSWISRNHIAQRILSRRFDDPFKLDLMVKDIDIALTLAGSLGLESPLAEAARRLWHAARDGIDPGSSVSELVRALERRAGTALTPGKAGL
ncbi:MAG TPA: NAD(P)-dependent oxidoreductase [Stellaceae bacterium]|nr:NAD(P)-dependent oxidoreductase [Stellaceae bacterium]